MSDKQILSKKNSH